MRLHEIFDFMELKGARICVLLGAEMKYNLVIALIALWLCITKINKSVA
jgi:hypothetical protein